MLVLFIQEHFATVKVATVSFCTLDPKNRKLFAFINRKKKRNFCHVFQASESDVSRIIIVQLKGSSVESLHVFLVA